MLFNDPTRDFVAGIIDAEGNLQILKKGSIRLVVVNTNVTILSAVRRVLADIGIEIAIRPYGKPKGNERQRYRVVIYGRGNVEKVLKVIPLQHPKLFSIPLFSSPSWGRKSGNERDPRPQLLPPPPGGGHIGGTAAV